MKSFYNIMVLLLDISWILSADSGEIYILTYLPTASSSPALFIYVNNNQVHMIIDPSARIGP